MDADRAHALGELLNVKQLPPLSTTATRLLEAVANDEIDLKSLAAIIDQDPGLAARIVGLANSAYFAQPAPVYSVEEAVIRVLGLNMVKSIALGISVAGVFNLEKCPLFDLPGYWYRALTAAQLTRSLSLLLPVNNRPDAAALYLGGLLHNLGTLLLVHARGEAYAGVLGRMVRTPAADLLAVEREQLGLDHREAGACLAGRWHLPEVIVTMMEKVGESGYRGAAQTEVVLLSGAVDWLEGNRSAQAYALAESRWWDEIDGLERERISPLEEAFRGQLDALEQLARQLA